MNGSTLVKGISSTVIATPRLKTHLLAGGPEEGVPVIFIHGNVSSSRFWEENLAALSPHYRRLIPDCGGSATRKPSQWTRRGACGISQMTCTVW